MSWCDIEVSKDVLKEYSILTGLCMDDPVCVAIAQYMESYIKNICLIDSGNVRGGLNQLIYLYPGVYWFPIEIARFLFGVSTFDYNGDENSAAIYRKALFGDSEYVPMKEFLTHAAICSFGYVATLSELNARVCERIREANKNIQEVWSEAFFLGIFCGMPALSDLLLLENKLSGFEVESLSPLRYSVRFKEDDMLDPNSSEVRDAVKVELEKFRKTLNEIRQLSEAELMRLYIYVKSKHKCKCGGKCGG